MTIQFYLIAIVIIFTIVIIENAEGFIEFKKYYVINSDRVCGDKLCSEVDVERSKKGLSTRNIEVCGNKLCSEEIQSTVSEDTPKNQIERGVLLSEIVCKINYKLVLKAKDLHPACVKPQSVEKLAEYGWALNKEQQEMLLGQLLVETEKRISKKIPESNDVSLQITPDEIDGKRYLVINGFGWHRLHLVGLTISNEENNFETFVDSKTTDRGDLYLPWAIPEELITGTYTFHATDGIHEYQMDIPISGN